MEEYSTLNYTALFGKVYRTIFPSKRRRLVFKTGVIMYIQKDAYKTLFENIEIMRHPKLKAPVHFSVISCSILCERSLSSATAVHKPQIIKQPL